MTSTAAGGHQPLACGGAHGGGADGPAAAAGSQPAARGYGGANARVPAGGGEG